MNNMPLIVTFVLITPFQNALLFNFLRCAELLDAGRMENAIAQSHRLANKHCL